jgi:hypothetical protein
MLNFFGREGERDTTNKESRETGGVGEGSKTTFKKEGPLF